jgi:hypothetical protein
MPELADPLSQPPKEVAMTANRSYGTGWRLGRAANCVLLGLTFLWAVPGVSAKVFGAFIEMIAVLIVIRVIRIKKTSRMMAQAPAPYADLQAAMARLHEAEDRDRHGRE